MKSAFTLLELIIVIAIIGILSAVAVPKFAGLRDNAKISAEMQTASAVQTIIDSIHTEWITNRCRFNWGVNNALNSEDDLSDEGYPNALGNELQNILSNVQDWTCTGTGADKATCTGPASNSKNGVETCKDGKPCTSRHWTYYDNNGSFVLSD